MFRLIISNRLAKYRKLRCVGYVERMEKTSKEFWWRNLLENIHFEDQEGNGKVTMIILRRQILRIGSGRNCRPFSCPL
jgi:hypothetical protein